MSETKSNSLENALEFLEDYNLTNLSRPNNYEIICYVLNSTETVSTRDIERILTVCTHDLKEDMKYTVEALKVISSVIKQPQVITKQPDLVPSALAILDLLRSIATNNMKGLRTLCMDTLLNYPNETLIKVASSHTGSILDIYSEASPVAESTSLLLLNFLHKLLKIIPPDKRNVFVKKGLDQWFNFVLPKSFYFVSLCQESSLKALEVLELLTNDLVDIDYSENVTWQKVTMPCIYTPEKYPDIMRNLLEAGAPTWHRLWIVLVKLLKSQITMNKHKNGSPINSLLPVVEMAFKMDVTNRCRAFQCWDVLIDNFSTETVESLVEKRIKLLLIPLKSNNAKVEETVVAKFNTWFNLLTKFESQLQKLKDGILLLFIQFCFGKYVDEQKNIFIPGLISVNVKKMSVQKFIEVFGHVDCDICVTSPKLLKLFINAQLLKDHWKDYKYALKVATKICSETSLIHQAVHLWRSFVSTIAQLPDDSVRVYFFCDVLMLLEKLLQEGQHDKQCIDIVYNVLTESIFDGEKFKTLLKTKDLIDTEDGPIHKVLSVLLQIFQKHDYLIYNSFNVDESIKKLKQITDCMIDTVICPANRMSQWLLLYMSANDNTIILWTALAESLNESSHDLTDANLYLVLLWPLKNMKKLKFIPKKCVTVWYAMFNVVFPKLNTTLVEEFSRTLLSNSDHESSSTYFMLYASLGFVKHCLAKDDVNFEKEIELFKDIVNKIANYSEIENVFPALVDTVVLLINMTSGSQDLLAQHSVSITNTTLRLLLQALKDNIYEKDQMTAAECLLNSIKTLIASRSHSDLKSSILAFLIESSDSVSKVQPSLKLKVLSIMKTHLQSITANDSLYQNLKSSVENIENDASADKTIKKTAFNTPNVTIIKKKRKETGIVDTVIENGEEYVVVKSNWKFNPKKLTDAQKEKLTKKRDDIPALYQDLSQSQDEFQLQSWKTDSQDTSTTSKSTSNSGDATSILKNVPSTYIVPKIMENVLTEKVTTGIDAQKNMTDDVVSVKIRSSPAVKDKSNRMTLKDRVFKNLKVLVESGSVKNKSTEFSKKESGEVIKVPLKVSAGTVSVEEKSTNLSQTITNGVTTPVTKEKLIINAMNSAPSKISLERPARVKRKPKKFDDSELFALKKRRYSHCDSNSDGDRSVKSKGVTCTKDNITAKDYTNSKDNLTTAEYANAEDDAATEDYAAAEDVNNKDINNTKVHKLDSKIESSDIGLIVQIDSENLKIQNNTIKTNPNTHSECAIEDSETTNCTMDELTTINQEVRSSENTVQECNDKPSSCNEIVKDAVLNVTSLTVISDSKLKPSEELIRNSKEKPSTKKPKKSKIEKELAIDMVEGHPFLQSQSEKRVRRNIITNLNPNSTRRKSLIEKLNKSKSIVKPIPKVDKKTKDLKNENNKTDQNIVDDEENKKSPDSSDLPSSEDPSSSEDVIESSQDSSITTLSVKSTKTTKKQSTTSTATIKEPEKNIKGVSETQKNLKCDIECNNTLEESKEDIELPKNKTAEQEVCLDLTEDMDTEPIEVFDTPSDEVAIVEEKKEVIFLNSNDTGSQLDTQNTANADTEPLNTIEFEKSIDGNCEIPKISVGLCSIEKNCDQTVTPISETIDEPVEKISEPENISVRVEDETNETVDDNQRKKEFLNNTSEISPIKTMSPIRNSRSPTPEANTDYVVIKLSSPVHINGEPYEKSDSPEIFTDDKVSHENQDKSPPREDINMVTNNSSPSLSLKRSRPQVRSLGRGAQMLGLCVPDHLQTITNTEKYMEPEEPKKCPTPSSSVARRNLRILYSSTNDNTDSEQNENSENFLKFKRSLPTSTCSPAGPILKRKLADISDDLTNSPASKRKRVSFHDPPVSTTIAVQKYIEPGGIRSPQCSALKRLERASRPHANMKSPKRLDTAFKLDTVLSKAVESFNEGDNNLTADSEMSSLDQTPAVEIIKTSELNDTDPICPDLINCLDPIDNIAIELSSPAMQSLLVKELEGKVVTIADLAKMTELEVNRLCIKAPKVEVAKKVLADYIVKKAAVDMVSEVDAPREKEVEELPQTIYMDIEVQTTMLAVNDSVAQTVKLETRLTETQTDALSLASSSAQTDESGCKSTADVVSSCLRERTDFVEQLIDQLEDTSKQKIAETMPFSDLVDLLMDKTNADNSKQILNRVLEQQCERNPRKELSYLRDFLSSKYDTKDLLMFCSRLLQKLHDKS